MAIIHRPLSSSFLWFMLDSYKAIRKRNYLGAYGYGIFLTMGNAKDLYHQQ